jgi:branched-chain amino acid transport system permease protein
MKNLDLNADPRSVRAKNLAEYGFWAFTLFVPFIFPTSLSLATSIVIMAMFAVSLDLVLGFAGIVTLGHAMYFGIGAYSAAWLALAGVAEPLTGLVLASIVAGLAAAVIGPVVLRLNGLPLIMVSMVLGIGCFELANRLTDFTGGDNGLNGFTIEPLLGRFEWSAYGRVEYIYALVCLFLTFQAVKRIVQSPFGLALRGVHLNPARMKLVGAPVQRHLWVAYVIGALLAGAAGALATQTTKFVGLSVFSVAASVDVLVMLVVGGVGALYGSLIGATVYMLVHHLASQWNPYHWMFIIGALLMIVVRLGQGGIHAAATQLLRRIGGRQ